MGKGKRGKWKQRKKLERLTHVGPPDVVLGLPDWHREQGPEEGLSRDVLPGAVPCDVELSFCFLKGVRSFFWAFRVFFRFRVFFLSFRREKNSKELTWGSRWSVRRQSASGNGSNSSLRFARNWGRGGRGGGEDQVSSEVEKGATEKKKEKEKKGGKRRGEKEGDSRSTLSLKPTRQVRGERPRRPLRQQPHEPVPVAVAERGVVRGAAPGRAPPAAVVRLEGGSLRGLRPGREGKK